MKINTARMTANTELPATVSALPSECCARPAPAPRRLIAEIKPSRASRVMPVSRLRFICGLLAML